MVPLVVDAISFAVPKLRAPLERAQKVAKQPLAWINKFLKKYVCNALLFFWCKYEEPILRQGILQQDILRQGIFRQGISWPSILRHGILRKDILWQSILWQGI